MLKKLKHKGVAMVEYAVLLAFVCSISGLYMSDTSLSASIDNTITKVVKLLAEEDFATSFKKKLDGLFLSALPAPNEKGENGKLTLGKAIVSNKGLLVNDYLQELGFSATLISASQAQTNGELKAWVDSLPDTIEGVSGLKLDKVVSIISTDQQTGKTYNIQYAYSNVKNTQTYLLGSRVLDVTDSN